MAVAQFLVVRPHRAHDKNITASWFGDIGFSHHIFHHRRWISDVGRRCSGVVSHHDGFDFVRHDDCSRRLSCQRTFWISPQQTAARLDMKLWPNTSLEPTPVTPVSFRCGFLVGGCHRRRGSVLGR